MVKKNIVLTGLMGSGKTTVGRELSKILDMSFIDIDEDIENSFGSIKSLFEKGENYFREIETSRIKIISQRENTVISTGGGAVLRKENIDALKQKGIIFYLNRSVEDILKTMDTSNRPLLSMGPDRLYKIYDERKHLYLDSADFVIDASEISRAVSDICGIWRNNFLIKES